MGAALVAVAGLLVLAFDRRAAVQSADAGSGWRFRGLGENPNTSSMLFAVALPLTLWLLTSCLLGTTPPLGSAMSFFASG